MAPNGPVQDLDFDAIMAQAKRSSGLATQHAVEDLIAEIRRLRDLVDEFRKREASQDRIREELTRERDACCARVDAVLKLADDWEGDGADLPRSMTQRLRRVAGGRRP